MRGGVPFFISWKTKNMFIMLNPIYLDMPGPVPLFPNCPFGLPHHSPTRLISQNPMPQCWKYHCSLCPDKCAPRSCTTLPPKRVIKLKRGTSITLFSCTCELLLFLVSSLCCCKYSWARSCRKRTTPRGRSAAISPAGVINCKV